MSEKDYQTKRVRKPIPITPGSTVRPEFMYQQNIHNILKRGIPQPTMPQIFSDNFNVGDKIDNYNRVQTALEKFNSLPAEARKSFDNNPAKLIAAIENSDYDALTRSGILSKIEPIKNEPKQDPPTQS